MKDLSARWQKLIIWLTGYLNIVAFVVAGGYFYFKTEREEVKSSAKIALIVTAFFTALDILRLFIQYCYNIASTSASWLSTTTWVVALIKIIVFVALFIVDMTVGFGNLTKNVKTSANQEEMKEENEDKAE